MPRKKILTPIRSFIQFTLKESHNFLTERRLQNRLSDVMVGIFITLFLGYFFFFLLLPLFHVLLKAFYTKEGFTLAYVKLLFYDADFKNSFLNSLKIASITTILSILIAIPLALIHTRVRYLGKEVFASILIASTIVPPFIGTLGLKYIFSQYGTLNMLLMKIGWTAAPILFFKAGNLTPLICIQAIRFFPIMYLSLVATFMNIDPSLDEVAITLGIGRWRRYKDILLPLARPGLLAGAILIFIRSLTDLGTPLITNFKTVLPIIIFEQIQQISTSNYGYVLLLAMILFTLLLSLLFQSLLHVDGRHRSISRTYISRKIYRPSLWEKLLIYSSFTLLSVLVFLPHILVVILSLKAYWVNTPFPTAYTFNAYQAVIQEGGIKSLINSCFYATNSTLLMMVLGIGTAYLIVKYPKKIARWIDTIAMFPLVLPGVLIGFSYYVTYMDTPIGPNKLPGFLLTVAYSMRYLPYVVRSGVAAFQQINPSLEEAAMVFGSSRFQLLFRISIPIILPTVISSIFLVFSKSIFEVSSSLMLASNEADFPVSKVMYQFCTTLGGGDSKAAALAVMALIIVGFANFLAGYWRAKKIDQGYKTE